MSKSKHKERAGGDGSSSNGSSAGGSGTVTTDVDFDQRVKALVEEILQGQSTRSPPSISGEPSGRYVVVRVGLVNSGGRGSLVAVHL